jgi:hypothetical protein
MRSEELALFINKGLEHTGYVHGHFFNLSRVELLDFAHHTHVIGSDKVNGDTLSAESTTTTDTVNVVFAVGRQVIVDDKGNLLNIDTTGEEISGNEHTRRSRAELLHDDITLSLVHITVHGRHGEIAGGELVGQPVDFPASVAEDDGLGDGDSLVQIGKGVELPLFLFDCNVELLDTFEGKFSLLDQNADRVAHELGGNLQHVLWHGGREQDDLSGLRQKLEDVVNLFGETARQHLVGLVKNEELHAVRLEHTTLNHVLDTTWSSNDNLRTLGESLDVITDTGATDASVAFNFHEIANGYHDLLDLLSQLTSWSENEGLAGLEIRINLLQSRDGKGGSLSGTGLSLSNNIAAL